MNSRLLPVGGLPFAFVLALVLAGCGPFNGGGILGGGPQAETLKVAFKQSDTETYHVHVVTDVLETGPAAPNLVPTGHAGSADTSTKVSTDTTATETLKVISVDSSGVATIDVTGSDIKLKAQPPIDSTPRPIHSTVRMASDGEIVAGGGRSSGGLGIPAGDQAVILPDHPVKPKDSWTKHVSRAYPVGEGTLSFDITSHFLRQEKVNGLQTDVIRTTYGGPVDLLIDPAKAAGQPGSTQGTRIHQQGTISVDATTWFDPKAGRIQKASVVNDIDYNLDFSGLPGGSTKITGKDRVDTDRA